MSLSITREASMHRTFAQKALLTVQRDMAKLQEQMATGRAVSRPSDDPTAFAHARQLGILEQRYTQYQRNIDNARTWMDMGQQSLEHIVELFAQAYERGISSLNRISFGDGELEQMANEIIAIRDNVMVAMNARIGDEYLFGGSNRTAPTAFTIDGDNLTYNGNDQEPLRNVGNGMTLPVAISGNRLLNTSDGDTIIDRLNDLIDAIQSGEFDATSEAVSRVEAARTHVLNLNAEVGARANRLSTAEEQLVEAKLVLANRRSQLEDTDYGEAITHYRRLENAYHATLKVTATLMQTTLLDYLR